MFLAGADYALAMALFLPCSKALAEGISMRGHALQGELVDVVICQMVLLALRPFTHVVRMGEEAREQGCGVY